MGANVRIGNRVGIDHASNYKRRTTNLVAIIRASLEKIDNRSFCSSAPPWLEEVPVRVQDDRAIRVQLLATTRCWLVTTYPLEGSREFPSSSTREKFLS